MAYDWEIDESDPKYALDKLVIGTDEWARFYTKQVTMWDQWSSYWAPRLEVAQKCMSYMRREIFTAGQRAKYRTLQDKWPIEPQVLKPIINIVSGQIADSVRTGSVTVDDATPPENAAPPEKVGILLKWWESRLKLEDKKKKALRFGLCHGFPMWVLFERKQVMEGLLGELDATLLPFKQVLPSPNFEDDDGADIEELMIVKKESKADLLRQHPDRKKAFEEHCETLRQDPGLLSQTTNLDTSLTSETRNKVMFDMLMSKTLEDTDGLYTTVYHLLPVKKKRKVFINEKTGDAQYLPDSWTPYEKMSWEQLNPDYNIQKTVEIPTLWVTKWGSNGFIWDNQQHWFQRSSLEHPERIVLPAVPFIADVVDGLPTGHGEDLLPLILMKAVAKTEALSDVRRGSGALNLFEGGSVMRPSRVTHELSQPEGVIVFKKGSRPADSYKREVRKPNDTYFALDDRLSRDIEETHRVNDAMAGTFAPRQSDVAKQREITQGFNPQSPYVDHYTAFGNNISQLLCYMIPYFWNEHRILEVTNDFNEKETLEINTTEYDAEGTAKIIALDITSAKYRIIPTKGDDSPTERQRQMRQFAELLEAFGNSLLSLMEYNPKFVANFFSTLPNRYAKEAAKGMAEHAEIMEQQQAQISQAETDLENRKLDDRKQIEMQKILLPRLMMKTDATDIQSSPMGFQVFINTLAALQKNAEHKVTPQQQPAMPPEMAGMTQAA